MGGIESDGAAANLMTARRGSGRERSTRPDSNIMAHWAALQNGAALTRPDGTVVDLDGSNNTAVDLDGSDGTAGDWKALRSD